MDKAHHMPTLCETFFTNYTPDVGYSSPHKHLM